MKITKPQVFQCIWIGLGTFACICLMLLAARQVFAVEPNPWPKQCDKVVKLMANACVSDLNVLYNEIMRRCSKDGGSLLEFNLPDGTVVKFHCAKVQEL